MKLVKTKSEVKEFVEFDGLLSGTLTHEIKSSSGEMKIIGPKIDPESWRQVIAFFIHTNSTSKSECQVRIFYDPIEKKFLFWAFPQSAGSGLTTKEVSGTEASNQRASLPNSAHLIAYGTGHSHCDISAFSSSVDENDERMVTGLHFTIGRLSSDVFDIHARFYVKSGCCFEPDLSLFWDIGEVGKMTPPESHDKIASWQMCQRPADLSFPKQWADNLIEIPKPAVTTYGGHFGDWRSQGFTPNEKPSRSLRLKDAIFDLRRELHGYNLNNEEVVEAVLEIAEEPIAAELIRVCVESGFEPYELLEEMEKKDSKPEKDIDPYQEAMMDYMGQ